MVAFRKSQFIINRMLFFNRNLPKNIPNSLFSINTQINRLIRPKQLTLKLYFLNGNLCPKKTLSRSHLPVKDHFHRIRKILRTIQWRICLDFRFFERPDRKGFKN